MIKYDHSLVGRRIRHRREELSLTQAAMAERCEMSTKYYADIERGSCGMSIDTLLTLCQGLEMAPNTLLLGEALPCFAKTELTRQILCALQECSEEEQHCVLEVIRLLTRRK